MRRKSLRTLSLVLSAAMVLSVANPGVTAMATEADRVMEQQLETSVSEEVEEATEVVTEKVTEAVTSETTTEDVVTSDIIAEIDEKRLQVQREGQELVSSVITDAVLAQMVLDAYNNGMDTTLTLNDFTVADLAEYTGALDFSTVSDASKVTSIKGLGTAMKASSIDISTCTGVTKIEDSEFLGCNFETFKMPNTITSIGEKAFFECEKMTDIYTGTTANTLPSGLLQVGQHAFQGNNSLTEITIPTLTDEGAVGMFQFCEKLEKITLGNGVTKVPVAAFHSTSSASANGLQVTFGTGLDKILDSAFYNANFDADFVMDLSKCTKITGIDANAFNGAQNLSTIILPASLMGSNTLEIGAYAFAMTSLKAIYPAGAEYDGIYLPDYTAATLGDGAFYGNTVVTAVSLSSSLDAIRDYTFDGCTSLAMVEQRQDTSNNCNVKWIGDCAFRKTAIENTEFLVDMTQLEQIGRQLHDTFDDGTGSAEISTIPLGGINNTNKTFDVKDPTKKLFNKKPVGSEVFTDCPNLTSITVPSSVKVIAQRAFYSTESDGISQVKDFTWSNALFPTVNVERKIWAEAFVGNYNLENVILPENSGESLVVGPAVFRDNISLISVGVEKSTNNTLPNTLADLGESAFYNCLSLPEIHIQSYNGGMPVLSIQTFEYCWSLKKATLPSQTTVIPYHFFGGCPLESFNFNEMTNLEEIENLVFVGNQFTEVDLSACTKLEELGAGSFAYADIVKKDYMKGSDYSIVPSPGTVPRLTTMILPKTVAVGLHINTGLFAYQEVFNTLYKSGSTADNQVVIPSYVVANNGGSKGIFAYSGVSKVVWEADTDPVAEDNRWNDIGPFMYEGCTNITDAKDVLPLYVEDIHRGVFSGSTITSADLSGFTNLRVLGDGAATGGEKGVFTGCEQLATVKFPATTSAENGIVLKEETFKLASALKNVDLGAVTDLQKNTFSTCTALQTIDLKNVKTVGEYAFSGCTALSTVDFSVVNEIGDNAFKNCSALVLTNNPFPDTLKTIGSKAFTEATQLGEVTLGAGIEKIGSSAFADSGVTAVDFSRASALTTIGESAFTSTQLAEFNISGTKVTVIPSKLLFDCPELTKATFGKEIEYISKNALAGCPKFLTFEFYTTTTVDEDVFYNEGADDVITGQKNGKSTDTSITIAVNVKTPEQVVIPVNRDLDFPYYVNKAGTSNIYYICIVDANAPKDLTVEDHLFVRAKTNSGYYKVQNSNEQDGGIYKVSNEYYEQLTVAPTISKNKQTVDVIRVTGLKESTGRDLEFNIYADIKFNCENEDVAIKSSPFNAKYKVKIEDAKTTGVLYSDSKLTTEVPENNNIQITKSNMTVRYYYDFVDEVVTDAVQKNYNLIVETSNPEVLYPGASSSAKSATVYTTQATTTNSKGEVSTDKTDMHFTLIPKGIGTATITIYPEECTEEQRHLYKKTYTFTVNSDVSSISLEVPSAYKSEAKQGDEFSVFSSYKTYLGQQCTVDNILDYNKLTNRNITYTSSAPEYVSVDQMGNVKILKADASVKKVTITATAQNSNDKQVKGTCSINVKNPSVKKDAVVEDVTTGAKVQVTKTSTTDLQGEVTYQGPTDSNAAEIVVPDTVAINGVQYKVTSIKDDLFKNNKKVTRITIGSYIEKIEKEAFSGCTALSSVTIGDGVEQIGQKAFYGCKKLKTVTIGSNSKLKTIGVSAFQNCTALKKVTIPNSVQKIDKKAFYNCKKLATVTINKKGKLTTIGDSAFGKCVALKSILLPNKFKTLGASAFYNCKKLKTITIKSTYLKSVGKNAFKGIYKKATIKVPKKKLSAYKKLLKGKGQKSTVKIKKG